MKKGVMTVCLILLISLVACSNEDKVELSQIEYAMIEMGNNIGFDYLRSDDPPEVIEARILTTLHNMKALQDSIPEDKSVFIRKIRIDEIEVLVTQEQIHEQPKEIRNEIANIFMEYFNESNLDEEKDFANLSIEIRNDILE
ncbi:hypothetical protein [Aquisalibacillus elongatus]|uniref:hypothetical protein n=1 Tax=Aquisalibacillus elongatus TaxID=485577 RepID=UPI000F5430B9|nr:hypothetical protein [Aquisalibacillus elongatus]